MGGIWLEPDGLRYGPKAYTISYYLAQEEAGKGYMTEALLAFIPWAFEELRADLLSARVFAPNKGSARLLQKVGFVRAPCAGWWRQGALLMTTCSFRCCRRIGRFERGLPGFLCFWRGRIRQGNYFLFGRKHI